VAVKLVGDSAFVVSLPLSAFQHGELDRSEQIRKVTFIPPNAGPGGLWLVRPEVPRGGHPWWFFAYSGFDLAGFFSTRRRRNNPTRDVTIGIWGSLVICPVLYAVVSVCGSRACCFR